MKHWQKVKEYTYRAEVGELPSLQSQDLRREQRKGHSFLMHDYKITIFTGAKTTRRNNIWKKENYI